MPKAFEPRDFASLGFLLLQEPVTPLEPSWSDIKSARERTAIDRAYYAVFLALKRKLIMARDDWSRNPDLFPQERIHQMMTEAVGAALGRQHLFYEGYKDLNTARTAVTYDLPGAEENDGEDLVDVAKGMLEKAGLGLSENEALKVAEHLWRINKNRNLRRAGF